MNLPPKLDRTPSNHRGATTGVRCLERSFEGQDSKPPVKLVVFDCDETLTLSTFMPKDHGFGARIGWNEWGDYIAGVNFDSPFAEGSRLERLKDMLQDLLVGDGGQQRALAVLTRNERGPVACLNLLMMAKLAQYLSVIWALPYRYGQPAGVYRVGTEWRLFSPPVNNTFDHKADVLRCVAQNPSEWFPQLAEGVDVAKALEFLFGLRDEEIVLVDDVRTNFQSPYSKESKLLRYCKVARYDGHHPQMGFVPDMGGIGAMSVSDYATLTNFVNKPWTFKAAFAAEFMEASSDDPPERLPVELVVFEFDETLSLCTFVVEEVGFATEIGYSCSTEAVKAHSVEYNFESPYVSGSRLEKLKRTLGQLAEEHTLAILTENSVGAVAVLNLLLNVDMACFFDAIWAPSADPDFPTAVYRSGAHWNKFVVPVGKIESRAHRAEMLHRIADEPSEWFPNLAEGHKGNLAALKESSGVFGIVAVDDERTNFHSSYHGNQSVPRYCRVARYDDEYRDAGFIVHMGGLGAKTDQDYQGLLDFVEKPWRFRVADAEVSPDRLMAAASFRSESLPLEEGMPLERRQTEETVDKTPIRRVSVRSLLGSDGPSSGDLASSA